MIRTLALIACLVLGLTAQQAAAFAIVCFGTWDEMSAALADGRGEYQAAEMLGKNGHALSLFVSPDTGTWTFTSTPPGGRTCTLGYGSDFQATGRGKTETAGELH